MLPVPSYKESWDRKRQWYEDNGFLDQVITSMACFRRTSLLSSRSEHLTASET
jgi:hypothetical protein